jgi:glyoxylase-like metal-dependent hydrolase (beta-lactamase superfamily II)
MKLYSIDTGYFKLDGGAMFGVVPKSIWNKLNPADENNMCSWAMRCLLIEHDKRLILIDTGIGNKQNAAFFRHFYLHGDATLENSIRKAGFSPNDVTDVFLTHLHFDHVGGATKYDDTNKNIIPTFKNATYWSNELHWENAIQPNPREKASFLKDNLIPLKESGQLQFIDGDSPFSFIEILYVDGHTEKQMLPLISFNGKKLLYLADLIPSSMHIKLPYVISYDVRPLISMQEKERILHKAFDEDIYLMFEHDPKIECGKLDKNENGFALRSLNLNEI